MNEIHDYFIKSITKLIENSENTSAFLWLKGFSIQHHNDGGDFKIKPEIISFHESWIENKIMTEKSPVFIIPILEQAWIQLIAWVDESPIARYNSSECEPIIEMLSPSVELKKLLTLFAYPHEHGDTQKTIQRLNTTNFKDSHIKIGEQTNNDNADAFYLWNLARKNMYELQDERDLEVEKQISTAVLTTPKLINSGWFKKDRELRLDALWDSVLYFKNKEPSEIRSDLKQMLKSGAQLDNERAGENLLSFYAKWNPLVLEALLEHINIQENQWLMAELVDPLIRFSHVESQNPSRISLLEKFNSVSQIPTDLLIKTLLRTCMEPSKGSNTGRSLSQLDMVEKIQNKLLDGVPLTQLFNRIGETEAALKILINSTSDCIAVKEKEEAKEKNLKRNTTGFWDLVGMNFKIESKPDSENLSENWLDEKLDEISIQSPVLLKLKQLGLDFLQESSEGGSAYHYLLETSESITTEYSIARLYRLWKELGVDWNKLDRNGDHFRYLKHKYMDLTIQDACLYIDEINKKETEEVLRKNLMIKTAQDIPKRSRF